MRARHPRGRRDDAASAHRPGRRPGCFHRGSASPTNDRIPGSNRDHVYAERRGERQALHEVAAPEPRLQHEPMGPLEAQALQPRRCATPVAVQELEGGADADEPGPRQLLPQARRQRHVAGEGHAEVGDVGARGHQRVGQRVELRGQRLVGRLLAGDRIGAQPGVDFRRWSAARAAVPAARRTAGSRRPAARPLPSATTPCRSP